MRRTLAVLASTSGVHRVMGSSPTDVPTAAQTICAGILSFFRLFSFHSDAHAAQTQFLDICFACMYGVYECATSDCKEERGRLLVGRENRNTAFFVS